MRRIIFVIIILMTVSAGYGEEGTYADMRIREQTELQYSEEMKAFDPPVNGLDAYADLFDGEKGEAWRVIDEEFYGATVAEIQGAYESGELTVSEYISTCLWKIKRSEEAGLHIVIQVNPGLRERIDELESREDVSGMPLYGIPVVLKANIGTGPYLETTAGAAALRGGYMEEDPYIVRRIREAGGIILAKVNLSEWANFMTDKSANGFSSIGGQTVNPYGRFDVGGSSSGSAAAVAYGIAPLAVGTETSGSIIYPCSQNSVSGLKPTTGSVSRDGILPLSVTQDTAGPMALNVADATLLYDVIKGYDPSDAATGIMKGWNHEVTKLDGMFLKGLRVAVVRNKAVEEYLYRSGDREILKKAVRDLKRAGARITYVDLDESIFEKIDVTPVFRKEFRRDLDFYLGRIVRGVNVKGLADVIIYNEGDPERRMPLGQTILIRSLGEERSGDLIRHIAENNALAARGVIDGLLASADADVLITLSNYLSYIYAAAGYPAVNIPAGYRTGGEPVGITFIGKGLEDGKLLNAAFSFERATQAHTRP